ncbi:MAG: SDR family oxidoreductase [Stappiaceae bacterium]
MKNLSGKSAIITGASRGIGAATAYELAKKGMCVVLFARNENEINNHADAIIREGGKALAVSGDVSKFEDLARAVDHCQEAFGSVDVLVNNAGLIEPIARIAQSDPEEWARVADVNYKGVYFGMRAVLPIMEKQQAGTIINISSGAATGALEGWSHYCSSKAAVLSLTRCGHKEYGDKGIHVVGLSPGTVATDMQVTIRTSGVNPVSQLDPSVHISSQWVARAIAWLCAEGAEEFAGDDFSIKTEEGRRRVGLID